MKSYNQIFSENLNELMRKEGLSQNCLGRKLGIPASSVNLWCTGRSIPRPQKMDALCELFGVTQAELTTDKDEIPNSLSDSDSWNYMCWRWYFAE